VTIIELNAFRWVAAQDFYAALLCALGAPDWHGQNVNALVDSMISGGINAVEQPFRIIVRGLDGAKREAKEELRFAIEALVNEGARCHVGNDGTATIEVVWPLSSGPWHEE
jgi:RNAse (barnase) inhibitor barstar